MTSIHIHIHSRDRKAKGRDAPNLQSLSLSDVRSALNNGGYNDSGDIKSARFSKMVREGQAMYEITYIDDDGRNAIGKVYVEEKGGRLVADY